MPARVADVHLDAAVGQLVHRVAEGDVVERAELLHAPVDGHELVDLEPEVGMRRRLARALEQVQLAVAGAEPEDREAEVRRRQRLEPELVDVEAPRLLEVVRDDADVVQVTGATRASSLRRSAPQPGR